MLCQGKKSPQKVRPCSSEPKRPGKSGRYFTVLNCDSEKGLSFETCGARVALGNAETGEQATKEALPVLALQVGAVLAAVAPVYLLKL